MECPYCGEEMEQGVIQSPHEIAWKNKKSYIGTAKFHKGSIILSKLYMLQGSTVIANCCHKCEKIIIDYKDGSCDMKPNKISNIHIYILDILFLFNESKAIRKILNYELRSLYIIYT